MIKSCKFKHIKPPFSKTPKTLTPYVLLFTKMLISLTNTLLPSFPQHPNSPSPSKSINHLPIPRTYHHPGRVALQAVSGSGFLSAIGNAIEEEEYRKARDEVNRKGADLAGYSVEGISVGGHETCVILPEFKSAFDIGRCPPKAVSQNFLFITHAHLDHIVSKPLNL